jgi:8-oxo-dGTP pyrophosphatase MutT (NUDIX family)
LTKEGFLDSLSPKLTGEEPARLVPTKSAGVAVIFRDLAGDEEVLLIRKAERRGDPWSGQIAFPGGMVNAGDESFEEAASRETLEEVGIDLSSNAIFLGYMRELKAHMREIVVVPSVFKLETASGVTLNEEVASSEWVALKSLARKEARSTYALGERGEETAFPSLVYRDFVIWGLTERILSVIIGDRTEAVDDDRMPGEGEL